MQTEDLAEPPPTSLTKIMAFKSNIFEVSAEYSGWNAPPHFINYSLSAPSAVVASPLMHNLLIRAASKSLIGEEWCQQMEKPRESLVSSVFFSKFTNQLLTSYEERRFNIELKSLVKFCQINEQQQLYYISKNRQCLLNH